MENTESAIQSKVSRDEFLGAIAKVDEQFRSLGEDNKEIKEAVKEISALLRGVR